MKRLFKIILVFLRNKVIEIGRGLLFVLCVAAVCFLAVFLVGLIGAGYSYLDPQGFLRMCKDSNYHYTETYLMIGFCLLIVFIIIPGFIIWILCEFAKWFINWIKDNWHKAVREVDDPSDSWLSALKNLENKLK